MFKCKFLPRWRKTASPLKVEHFDSVQENNEKYKRHQNEIYGKKKDISNV